MSLASPPINSWGFIYDNATVAVPYGTTITPGATNAEGSWTEVAAAASITADIQCCEMVVSVGFTSAQAKNHLLDIGIDPAGGTSYTAWLSNLVCGSSGNLQSGVNGAGPRAFQFPCSIKAGSSVAVRMQGSNGTAGTVGVKIRFFGKPSRPEMWRPAAYTETIGTITNSNGVSFTPGDSDWGSWTSLGTTSKRLWWWQLGAQIDNTVYSAQTCKVQLAYGDGSNKHLIGELALGMTTQENIGHGLLLPSYWDVPVGGTLYVRGGCNATPLSGFNAVAVGFGG